MAELEDKIGAVLNNPQLMQQIMSMAQSFGQQNPSPQPHPPQEQANPVLDPAMLQKLAGIASAAGGDDQQKALQHFINSGMREGRMASESFDVDSYRNANQDLRIAFRSDLKRYYLHYLRNGIREGRSATGVDTLQNPVTVYQAVNYSPVYDYYFYTGYYKDISEAFGTDDVRILEHFVNNGMREHRRGCESFDVISYRLQYQDLRVAYGTDYPAYYRHYMRNGAKEGREGTGTTELQNPVTVLDGTDYAPVYNFRFYTENRLDCACHSGVGDVARAVRKNRRV
jgi:hypothetical protein